MHWTALCDSEGHGLDVKLQGHSRGNDIVISRLCFHLRTRLITSAVRAQFDFQPLAIISKWLDFLPCCVHASGQRDSLPYLLVLLLLQAMF